MDKTQADLDLYFLTRNVQWRYRLDQYEDATIAEMLKTVRSTVAEIKREIFEGDAPENADALIAELEALSSGLRKRISEDVATMSSVAGEYSVAEHTAIMSLDGAVKINTVALSAAQFREFLGGPTQGTPLPAWVDAAWGEAVSDKIRRNLNVAVLRGEGYQKAVRGLLDAGLADFSEREAVTIARTYAQTANVAAQMAVYQENDDLVKGWRWSSVLEPGYSKSGRGTCMSCASLDGRVFDLGKGPSIPLHPRCLTGETPVNAPDKVAAFVAPYSGPIIEIGLPDGTNISVTPNHMFLTDKGFVPAKSLDERSKIFYNAGANGPGSVVGIIRPDDHGKPSPIKDVVESMAKAPGMVTVRVPTASEYFHGDGEFFQGYVDVIAPDCFLRREGDTTIPEQGPEGELIFSDIVKLALSPECDFTKPLLWLWLATHCHVSGKSVSDVLLPAPASHHQPVCLGLPSAHNAELIKSALNDYSGNTKMLRDGVPGHSRVVHPDHIFNGDVFFVPGDDDGLSVDGLDSVSLQDRSHGPGVNGEVLGDFARRFSGQVTLTNLSFVRVGHFSGHVYDLQTLSSMYHVAGALSSNCRCVALPVTKSWRELGIDRDEIEAAIRPYTIRPDANIDAGGMRTIIESGRHQGDYASWWAKQPEAFKINAVGPGRYELLKSGKISFADLVDGDGRQRTLKELMGGIPSPPARSGFLSGAEKYIPFDDKVKALEWARQKYVDDFTLEKLPVSAINEINDAANNSLVRFGVRLSKIDNAGGQNLGICRYSLGKSVSVGLQQNLVKNPDKVIPKLTATFDRIKAEQLRQARLGLEQSPKGSKISEAISAKIEKWENSKRYSVVYDSARPAYSAASHEFAHAVAFKNTDAAIFFTKELTSAGISYNEKLAISQYGAGNPSELFAESFALLVDGRAKEIPESIYKILEKTIEMMEKK